MSISSVILHLTLVSASRGWNWLIVSVSMFSTSFGREPGKQPVLPDALSRYVLILNPMVSKIDQSQTRLCSRHGDENLQGSHVDNRHCAKVAERKLRHFGDEIGRGDGC